MHSLSLYILTFNCARTLVDVPRFSRHFFDALPRHASSSPDLIVLSLQEIAPIAYAFLGDSYLAPYYDSLTQVVDRAVAHRFDNTRYVNVLKDNSGMTGLMVFARSDTAESLSSVDTAKVGFGFQQMGNKGAVGARLAYAAPEARDGRVDLTFIAAHLAPMEGAVQQRNDDWRSIVERLIFERPVATAPDNLQTEEDSESAALLRSSTADSDHHRGIFVPTSYLFVAGDLNYRTSDRSPAKEDITRFPLANVDPSSPSHYSHLLKEDQLIREMKQSRSFHGLTEAPIHFPPTYKYTSAARQAATQDKETQEWLWTSARWPSWCDRVLYLESPPGMGEEARVEPLEYQSLPLFPTSDHRAVALLASVPIPTKRTESVTRIPAPFPVDPEWQQKRAAARNKEIVVGYLAFLSWTWEGNGFLLASMLGLVGTWFVLRSMLNI